MGHEFDSNFKQDLELEQAPLSDVSAEAQQLQANESADSQVVRSLRPRLVRAAVVLGALTGGVFAAEAVALPNDDNGTATAAQSPPNLRYFANIGSAQVSASKLTQKELIVGYDEHIIAPKKIEKSPGCHWTQGGFTNSMYVGAGNNRHIQYYYDPVPAELCPDKNSPTGEVKVAGGTTGRRCLNAATEHKKPHELAISQVLNVRSLDTSFKIIAKLSSEAVASCGYVQATDLVSQNFKLSDYVRSTGRVNQQAYLKLFDKIQQNFTAKIVCTPAQTTTTKTETVTQPGRTTTETGTTSTSTTTTTTTQTTTQTTPTTTPNYPPTIHVEQKTPGFEGVSEGDKIEICADVSTTPSTDQYSVQWTDKYPQDTLSPNFKDNGKDCTWFQAGSSPETDENVTAIVTDSASGLQSSDSSGQFPVRQPQ